MRKILFVLLSLGMAVVFFIACERDIWSPGNEVTYTWERPDWSCKNLDEKAWREARALYSLHQDEMESIMTRSSDGHPLFGNMVPAWTGSYSCQGDGYTTVETGLRVVVA